MPVSLYYCPQYAEQHELDSETLKNVFGHKVIHPFYVFETTKGEIVPVTHIGEPPEKIRSAFPDQFFVGDAHNRTPLVWRNGVLSPRAKEILDEKRVVHNPDGLRTQALSVLPEDQRPTEYEYKKPHAKKYHEDKNPYKDLQKLLMARRAAQADSDTDTTLSPA